MIDNESQSHGNCFFIYQKMNDMENVEKLQEEELACGVVTAEERVEDVAEAVAEAVGEPETEADAVREADIEIMDVSQEGDAGTASAGTEAADIDRLIAEAEARGYERGRTEGIEAWMNEGRRGRTPRREEPTESEVMILNNMRRSVWE